MATLLDRGPLTIAIFLGSIYCLNCLTTAGKSLGDDAVLAIFMREVETYCWRQSGELARAERRISSLLDGQSDAWLATYRSDRQNDRRRIPRSYVGWNPELYLDHTSDRFRTSVGA